MAGYKCKVKVKRQGVDNSMKTISGIQGRARNYLYRYDFSTGII